LGASTNAATNLILNGGTLSYTGAAVSTDRLFSVGTSGGTIDASGSGAVNFTNTGSMGLNSQTGTRTLTLTGTNTGSNTLAAIVGDNTGATSLVKNGAGTWSLTGTNTYSGGTTINAGTLNINNASALGTGTFTIAGGSNAIIDNTTASPITLSTNNAQAWNGDFTFTGTKNLNLGTGAVTMNASRIVTVSGGTLTVGGPISGATFGITKAGTGTLILNGVVGTNSGAVTMNSNSGTRTLAGNNTYTGGTTLNGGSTLNINAAGTSSTNSAIGTGTLTINGGTIDNTSGSAITLATNNAQAWNGDFTFAGSNNLNLGTGAVTMNASRTITVNGGTLTVGGPISGATFGITKAGAGTMVLS